MFRIPTSLLKCRIRGECLDLGPELVAELNEGLTVQGSGEVRNAKAVRAAERKNAYFVSAEIVGPGLEGTVGTWLSNDLREPGMILAVNETAVEFSVWPDGERTDAAVSMAEAGARESQECIG